jgi:hypothetical protein
VMVSKWLTMPCCDAQVTFNDDHTVMTSVTRYRALADNGTILGKLVLGVACNPYEPSESFKIWLAHSAMFDSVSRSTFLHLTLAVPIVPLRACIRASHSACRLHVPLAAACWDPAGKISCVVADDTYSGTCHGACLRLPLCCLLYTSEYIASRLMAACICICSRRKLPSECWREGQQTRQLSTISSMRGLCRSRLTANMYTYETLCELRLRNSQPADSGTSAALTHMLQSFIRD